MKFMHTTIYTSKFEESVKFYQDIFELKIQKQLPGAMRITFLADQAGDTCIELIDNPSQAYNGDGIAIGFECADVEKKYAEIKEKGLSPTDIMVSPACSFFFFKDPNGLTVQFIRFN